MMMLDWIVYILLWVLVSAVIRFLTGPLASIGVPYQIAPLLIVVTALVLIWKYQSDRYMIHRWKRKLKARFHF